MKRDELVEGRDSRGPRTSWWLGLVGLLACGSDPGAVNPTLARFDSMVALPACSGALVRFADAGARDRALVLTNGHCLEEEMPSPGEVVVDVPLLREVAILSGDGRRRDVKRWTTRIVVGTMTGTDLAILELDATYEELAELPGGRPLVLALDPPSPRDRVRVVSSGHLMMRDCQVAAIVPELREDAWVWRSSVRYVEPAAECLGRSGASGSPVLDAESGEVVAVHQTVNQSRALCTLNNPCEVDENGATTATKGATYAQQVVWLYGCRNAHGEISLDRPGCELAPPR